LLQLLGRGEQTVTSLAGHFTVSRSAISQHLAVLAAAGLVVSRREGRFQHYRLDPRGMTALRAELDSFWTRELDHIVRDAREASAALIPRRPAMPFEKSVFVPLPADETFALVTRPARLRRWQAITARVDLRAGGEYRWTIIPGHTARGTYTEVEPGKRVVFTWGWEGSDDLPPGASTVIITLEPVPGGTNIRLVHEGLTGEQAASHAEGWAHYAARLAEVAAQRARGAGGDAGPDEWGAVPADINPLTVAQATLAVCLRVLRGVAEADYGGATACTEFTVAQLGEHLIGSIGYLGAAAGAEVPAGGAVSAAGDATLETRVADAAQVALEAWDARGLDGTVKLGHHELPAAFALGIASIEFLVHAWDFAQATGQQVTVPDQVTAQVLDVAGQVVTPDIRDRGSFAAERQADPDAGLLDRLIAFTGRPR
jgi:uncharacterized protein (TIGR03086 family)